MNNLPAWPTGPSVAVIMVHGGRLPAGAAETAAEAGGRAVVVGSGTSVAASTLAGASEVWTLELDEGPRRLAEVLAAPLGGVPLVLLPASPDGRDLAPRLAATMGRPFLAEAVWVEVEVEVRDGSPAAGARMAESEASRTEAGLVRADLLRVNGQVVVPVECRHRAIATLALGVRPTPSGSMRPVVVPLRIAEAEQSAAGEAPSALGGSTVATSHDPEVLALIEPDPATMDLADATRVFGGGAGLVPRDANDEQARTLFTLLGAVAASLGASMGATRVATDAGWTAPERQIGTTGVAIDPDLYVAFGVSGAAQHTGGLGAPSDVVSVNTDPSCPMTAMADLGLVADATTLLLELAGRLGVTIPPELEAATVSARSTPSSPSSPSSSSSPRHA
jgi:electron transfer flavoprotein alpha subunit